MKILTVGYLHGAGGAERQIILLSNQLAKRGHEVTLCVLSEYKSKYPIDETVDIVDLTDAESGKLSIWKRFKAFRKFVIKTSPDVIVNYNLQSAYFCLGISKNTRGKVVYSERGDPYDKGKGKKHLSIYKLFPACADELNRKEDSSRDQKDICAQIRDVLNLFRDDEGKKLA